ncbi:MAG TPA: hypothetical protein VMQ17_03095 [Candidatus Sulfotelmatobacter sp.]|nr:hypothetical protein [Candidatus Sulfotelmatobacter sp.]
MARDGAATFPKPSAELRRRAYQAKLQMRALRADGAAAASAGGWTPIGPAPLASDATGNGTQDYHQLAGRATAVAASTTSVAYNASAGLFFAAIRYHGVYSSPDGVTWTPSTVNLVAVFSAVTSGQTTGPTV